MMSSHNPHVVLFPFMSKGHTIPLLQLARLLLRRGVAVTIFTTPANRPFFSKSLSDVGDAISLIDLPFPEDIPGVPPGIESTDKLPTMSLFAPFAAATKLMKPHFERALNTLPPVSFMITDGFLGWTLDSANQLGIPRLVYFGMNYFSTAVSRSVTSAGLIVKANGDDEPFTVPDFPWLSVTRNDFDSPFRDRDPKGPLFDFIMEQMVSTVNSHGLVVNSFCDLERVYMESYNREFVPKSWPVGPLCLAEPPRKKPPENQETPSYIKWLDGFHEQGKQVLYVAFGSQAEISPEQLREIKAGLEASEVNFLWVVRTNESELRGDGFEDRVKNRGLLVKGWVDQREILSHPSVKGFVSHCGWNSVLESICAAVPIAAWPMMAEQHLNARMAVEVIEIGVRVESYDGSVRGFVKSEGVEKAVRELMEGEIGKIARKNVKELSDSAINAIKEGGSSWLKLDELINEFHAKMKKNPDT